MKKFGIVLIVIGIVFFILEKVLNIESLASITKFGQWFFAPGVGFFVTSYFLKNKGKNKA